MKKFNILSLLSLFNLLFYFSMKSFWSGIENMFKVSWLQYLILIILVGIFVSSIILKMLKIRNVSNLVLLITSIVLTFALMYMFYLGIGSLHYVIRTFEQGIVVVAILYLIYYLIFRYSDCKLSKKRSFKITLFGLLTVLILITVFDLDINYISNSPVVFVVEDEYQIVWTTNTDASASVKVGEEIYYDLYAGSERSETKVHKVIVPMEVLDNAKSYTISSTTIIFRGPYSGIKGRTIKRTFDFYPVDETDGINYYALSDTHEYTKAASKAGSYFDNKLDFLVMIGDISSHLEMPEDIEIINQIAFKITKGERPVVYARGNHEVKADVADQLYQYVGSKNNEFYYTFKLGPIFGIVLDLGEDHDDNWWEFYGLAHFDQYRKEQTSFLNTVLQNKEFLDSDVKYRMVISHIPIAYVDENFLKEYKEEWTLLLNQMNIDIALSGHHHQLMPITTDIEAFKDLYFHINYSSKTSKFVGYRTNANFNTFIVSRRSEVQDIDVNENLFGQKLSGVAATIDFSNNIQIIKYTNSSNEMVKVVNPFTGIEVSEFQIDINNWR